MAFWRRKKPRVEERVEVVEERPPPPAYMGEVVIELIETEKGVFRDGGFELTDESRVLRVSNRSSIPVYSTEIVLENTDRVSLDERVFVQSLSSHGEEGDTYEEAYSVAEHTPPVMLRYRITMPKSRGNAVWYGLENIIELVVEAEPTMDLQRGRLILEYSPGEEIVNITVGHQTVGSVEKYADRVVWSVEGLAKGSKHMCGLRLTIVPRNEENVRLGELRAKVLVEGDTFSGVRVREATSRFLLNYSVRREEKEDEPGVWDLYVVLQNPYDMELKAEGEVVIMTGEIAGEYRCEYARLEADRVIVIDGSIGPGESMEVGPIGIKSPEIPKIKVRVGGGVEERIHIRAEGEYLMPLPQIPVMSARLEKSIEVVVDERLRKYVGEAEIPTLGNNIINISTRIINSGGADIGFVEIIDTLPPGMSEPKNIAIKLDGRTIRDVEKVTMSGPNGGLLLIVKTSRGLPRGKTLTLSYTLKPEKIPRSIVELEFPARARCSQAQDLEAMEVVLPEDRVPAIRVRHIVRAVEVFRGVRPVGKDEFVLAITIENRSDAPIVGYELRQLIPQNFEILEIHPEATRTTTEKGEEVSWAIDLEPREAKELQIRVRGKGRYSVDDLLGAEAI